ncbi:hypothetical protein DMC30DRAFT_420358 [Rhodotorula diobovata]|uniref:Uncharacterized protein n=1 Tax=Rhodotorula diobovata TaxID=5288 RepID=A0A5C5FJL7_9BASI|nr:hypothetical protein DMC30DRAFT_420358 [Rhodotorula diobovata]
MAPRGNEQQDGSDKPSKRPRLPSIRPLLDATGPPPLALFLVDKLAQPLVNLLLH